MGSAEKSSLQSRASSPFVFGFALRDARLRFTAVFEGISQSLIHSCFWWYLPEPCFYFGFEVAGIQAGAGILIE